MTQRLRSHLRVSAIIFAIVALTMQTVQPDRGAPTERYQPDAPPEVRAILRRACFDCHSNETRWPWYSQVAPLSWMIAAHVHDGRAALNFSYWPLYSASKRQHLRADIAEAVREDEMPLSSYLLLHPAAQLSGEDRQRIISWSESAGRTDSGPVTSRDLR
jgi:hypothetical protein